MNTPVKFAKDLTLMEDDDWERQATGRDKPRNRERSCPRQQRREIEKKRNLERSRLRQAKENAHAGLDCE